MPAPGWRTGLHTAELVAGELGSAERGAYGVAGDGANPASRIEGARKVYVARILVSDATNARAGAEFAARELDRVRVLGRRAPVRVYERVAPVAVLAERVRAFIALRPPPDWDGVHALDAK